MTKRCLLLALLAFGCGSSNQTGDDAGSGGSGGGGGEGGDTGGGSGGMVGTGTGGQSVGSGGTVVSGTGGRQPGGIGGAGGGAVLVGCMPDVGAMAGPQDFSPNSETQAMDQHTLIMSGGSIVRRQLQYFTTGSADHQHEVRFTDAELVALLAHQQVTVTTEGPPLDASAGHTHTVVVRPCSQL
jgi:hypothetical protein